MTPSGTIQPRYADERLWCGPAASTLRSTLSIQAAVASSIATATARPAYATYAAVEKWVDRCGSPAADESPRTKSRSRPTNNSRPTKPTRKTKKATRAPAAGAGAGRSSMRSSSLSIGARSASSSTAAVPGEPSAPCAAESSNNALRSIGSATTVLGAATEAGAAPATDAGTTPSPELAMSREITPVRRGGR